MVPDELARAGGIFEDDRLIAKANQAARTVWARLDALPRTDESWTGTNLRTTWSKVDLYAARCLIQNPSDSTARWARIATEMTGGNFAALPLIAPMVSTSDEAILDLIGVAEWIWLEVGVEPGFYRTDHLTDALQEIGRPTLERLATEKATPGTADRKDSGETNTAGPPRNPEEAAHPLDPAGPPARTARVRDAARAGLAYLDRPDFAAAIGRRDWHIFQMALVDEPGSDLDRAARELLRADRELPHTAHDLPRAAHDLPRTAHDLPRTARDLPGAARGLPRAGTAPVTLLREAARWWNDHRDEDPSERLAQLIDQAQRSDT